MIAEPRVLLVGHDASATGAPLAALAWARWAARSGAARVEVRLDRDGPLVEQFRGAVPTRVRPRAGRALVGAADAALGTAGGRRVRHAVDLGARRRIGADTTVVAASAAAWRSAAAFAPQSHLVLWLHELDGVADRVVPPGERAALLDATARIVAVGERVAEMAVDRWHVPSDRVSVVESFVDPLPADRPPAVEARRHDVVAVGSLVPRKGAEHVVGLIRLLGRDHPDLRAAWIGGPLDSAYADLVRQELRSDGGAPHLDLAGSVADVGPWWPASGVVVHLAREDPAPLVVLEAGLRGIPVVTWDTGGAADLVRQAGLGHLVAAPGDLVAVADQVAALLADPGTRARAGDALRAAAERRTTDQLAPALLDAVLGGAR